MRIAVMTFRLRAEWVHSQNEAKYQVKKARGSAAKYDKLSQGIARHPELVMSSEGGYLWRKENIFFRLSCLQFLRQ